VIREPDALLARLRAIHAAIRDAVVAACERENMEQLAAAVADEGGDTIFAIDRISEDVLLEHFGALAKEWPLVLIAEGLGADGRMVLPKGTPAREAELRVIVDPIDGTRGLMYQKRPAWILTGVAPNRGGETTLADIGLALQTEIPLVKQHLCDTLWVVNGAAGGERLNRISGDTSRLDPRPSRATTIAQGYGGLARFFPGGRDILAAVDDTVVERVLGRPPAGRAMAFEDQYISTGGQLYELMMGHDRWIADLRPLLDTRLRAKDRALGLTCHPYDICTESIARACGVIVTDAEGAPLNAPLDVTSDVAWIGFANGAIREQVWSALPGVLLEHGLHTSVDAAGIARFTATVRAHASDFVEDAPIVIARAPGRLDVMGGIADYSGSLVLELPLADATYVAAQRTNDAQIWVRSLTTRGVDVDAAASIAVSAIAPNGQPIDYDAARELFRANPRQHWAAYVAGALLVLARERGLVIRDGLRLLVDSTLPMGKGVASSAALEVAAMRALAGAYDLEIDGQTLGILCQRVENLVVGAPCGVMDQMTAACGEENRLLALLCQPADVIGHTSLPPGLELWGIDSGIRHEIGGADYGAVRVAAFMGYRILAHAFQMPIVDRGDGHVDIDDTRWHGYLANISPGDWRTLHKMIPEQMRGDEFLEMFQGISDRVTRVDPNREYAVRQATEHPILEHERVREFSYALDAGAASEAERARLGELMYASHASYSACGLGSSGTDRLVEMVRTSVGDGLYGAKITGGGSGGTVAVLARAGSRAAIERIANEYAAETGRAAMVLGGSSNGAMRSGARVLS